MKYASHANNCHINKSSFRFVRPKEYIEDDGGPKVAKVIASMWTNRSLREP